jgi:hypothetical protein
MAMADGTVYRFITDHLGSVRLVVNAADGTVAQRIDYDAFGRVVVPQNIVRRFRMASCCRKARFSRASSRCGPRLDRTVAKRAYSK